MKRMVLRTKLEQFTIYNLLTLELTKSVRGELPLEVEDLEDEVAGLSTRSEKLKSELKLSRILSKKEWN
jgi:hypothetical protein